MASERQIAANRSNAKRSTGPKSAAGKRRASQNALKHGLSVPSAVEFDADAQLLVQNAPQSMQNQPERLLAWANAQVVVDRVRQAQAHLLASGGDEISISQLRHLFAIDRYNKRASGKLRKALRKIGI